MKNVTINGRRKAGLFFLPLAAFCRDDFMQNMLPWLIGVPVSLIIIHIFSI